MNTHTKLQLPIMLQNGGRGLDSLYCGKWRKISKFCRGLNFDQTKTNVESICAIS